MRSTLVRVIEQSRELRGLWTIGGKLHQLRPSMAGRCILICSTAIRAQTRL
jgi:hypothetical protein